MLQNNSVDIGDFIQFTSAGIKIASFTQVRDAVTKRYKQIYGSDIDVSTASADGTFINDLCLIINNILQSVNLLYTNLDVKTANGVYLDALCSLSNIVRKQATQSVASLILKNENSEAVSFPKGLTFLDAAGTEWIYNDAIEIPANSQKSISVTCKEYGEVKAPAGWITTTLELTDLIVEQPEAASVGSNEETDSELRARRNQSNGGVGVTVTESLIGALRQISGIEDVKIYNNASNTAMTDTLDGTEVNAHTIYVIARYRQGIDIDDKTVGQLIFEKLTPGIGTQKFSDTSSLPSGEAKSYTYTQDVGGVVFDEFNTTVYWKKANALTTSVVVSIIAKDYFVEEELDEIAESMYTYLNNLNIGSTIQKSDLIAELMSSDPTFKGLQTYTVDPDSIVIGERGQLNPDAYFNFFSYTWTKSVINNQTVYRLTFNSSED